MKNLIIVFLSLLAISATSPTKTTPTTNKVYCQILSETHYDATGKMTRDSRYNYANKELISINCINNADKIFTTLSNNSREYKVLGFKNGLNQHNKETINDYGEVTYRDVHRSEQMEIALVYEYEDYTFKKTDKMFCRVKSIKIDVSGQPDAGFTDRYNYSGDKLISITRGDEDYLVEYMDDYTRKIPWDYGSYSIQTLNKYGKVLVSKSYNKQGEYKGKDVYTYIIE